jgi:Family of unknown function (DUF6790)
VGIGSIVGAAYRIFDGPQAAELIGYTRGNGGFQWENAMGDLAIGVVGVTTIQHRDPAVDRHPVADRDVGALRVVAVPKAVAVPNP